MGSNSTSDQPTLALRHAEVEKIAALLGMRSQQRRQFAYRSRHDDYVTIADDADGVSG